MIEEEPQIDENAQSRQLAVYGHQAQAKLMAMKVFIHVGNLSGQESHTSWSQGGTIFDPNIVGAADVGRNFYISQKYIGKMTRADVSSKYLKQLNPKVHINVAKTDDIQTIVSQHTCIVMLDNYDREYLIKLNKACREKNIGFIYAGNLGLYGFTFVDFGEKHEVIDATGEQEKIVHIQLITNQEEGMVLLHQGKKHMLNDGDVVCFREVQGMKQLNGNQFKITVKSPSSFSIGDTTKFGQYIGGGMAIEVKVPFYEKYYQLQKSLKYPYAPNTKQMPICNWQNFGEPEQFHVILNGILQFFSKHKRLPQNLNKQDVSQLTALCKQWQSSKIDQEGFQFKVQQVRQGLIQNVSMYAQTQISPVCSFWGGIITQQIVKLTGKYSPIRQWLHHHFFQVLDSHVHLKEKVETPQINSRYTDYVTIFGQSFVEKVQKVNAFLVGAGALGCEFIKMLALMGAGSTENSRIVCTDDDNIQISNLNRQFLFRKNHVGKNKSQVACHIGKKINHTCKFQSVKLKVCPQNEEYFNDTFWQNQDLIINAVDNVKARQFIDNQCVWYEKPLFQSGTLGTKCHSQIIIPHQTMSYNDITDPPQEQFAVCTLKLFPYKIQHTIQWARQYFQTVIAIPSHDLKQFYQKKNELIQKLFKENKKNPTMAVQRLQRMRRLHQINQSQSYAKCVETAVRIFQQAFYNQIATLLFAYPQDYISPETGKPYWSGLKRTPKALKLDVEDKTHLQFIQAASNIFAKAFNIPQQKDPNKVKQQIKKIPLKQYVPANKIKINEGKSDDSAIQLQKNEQEQEDTSKIQQQLLSISTEKFKVQNPVVFQKDDPTNWHIEFMGGVSNLRARNYRIEEVDNFKVKLIAGKIIPAIATTTAMVVGVVGIQIIKYLLKKDSNEKINDYYKNSTINLASSYFVFSYTSPPIQITDKQFDILMCQKVKAIPSKFTKWDKLVFKGPLTIRQLIQENQQKYGVVIQSINCNGTSELFNVTNKKDKQRIDMKIQDAVEEVIKKKIPKGRKSLLLQIITCRTKGDDVFCYLPDIKYILS